MWHKIFLKTSDVLGVAVCAWVMLPNHYHVLLKFQHGRDLAKFAQRLHGSTSRQINLLDNAQGRKTWYSYWDICIRGEADFWTRFNYIHHNPVRHGYVENPEDWEFSSYRFYLQEEGEDWLEKCWFDYPANSLLENDPQ
jgi:putative transposase